MRARPSDEGKAIIAFIACQRTIGVDSKIIIAIIARMTGDEITALRASRALTQVQFAAIFKVSQGTVSDWERGIKRPRRATVLAIRKWAKRRNGKTRRDK